MSRIRAALRQPLPYFVLLGAAVFVTDALSRRVAEEVELTPAARNEVAAQLEQSLGRPPTEPELQRGLEEWLDTELLAREAASLGLEENDAVIRAHLARKLQHIVRERSIVTKPTQAELEAQLAANRERYTKPDVFDLTHAFVRRLPSSAEDQPRVDEALARLRAGAEPKSVGDHFPRGPVFTRMTRLQLEQGLGAQLPDAVLREHPRDWQTVPSSRGTHLLRVDAVHSGAPELSSVRDALLVDLREQKKQAAVSEFTRELRKKYRVESAVPE